MKTLAPWEKEQDRRRRNERRCDLIRRLDSGKFEQYGGEGYHIALISLAFGERFERAILKAERTLAIAFMDRALSRQARAFKALSRSVPNQNGGR